MTFLSPKRMYYYYLYFLRRDAVKNFFIGLEVRKGIMTVDIKIRCDKWRNADMK